MMFIHAALGRAALHGTAAEGHAQNHPVRAADSQVNSVSKCRSISVNFLNRIRIFVFSFYSKNENNSHSEVVSYMLDVVVQADVVLNGWVLSSAHLPFR